MIYSTLVNKYFDMGRDHIIYNIRVSGITREPSDGTARAAML